MSILVGSVIIGGIKRISLIAASIVPLMAFIYLVGGLSVLIYNYENIIPSFSLIVLGNITTEYPLSIVSIILSTISLFRGSLS